MTAAILIACERSGARDRKIARQLARFASRHRAAVACLAARHVRLADLAVSFPALLFALAVPRRRFDPKPVIERAIAGAPLADLAGAARIPTWLRKLGPEAFQRPIPWLPDSPVFRRQIANHLPTSTKLASEWLSVVSASAYWGHERLAIWFARRVGSRQDRMAFEYSPLLALWAWHSATPSAPASRWITTVWRPEMSTRQAIEGACDWKRSVTAGIDMPAPISDVWAEPAIIDGYRFRPITSSQEVIDTALRFKNCIRDHASYLERGWRRLWIISHGETDLAVLSLGGNRVPSIGEISGPENRGVADEVVLAAHRWHRLHCPLVILADRDRPRVAREPWIATWRDYWLAKRRFPRWLPLRPPNRLFRWLEPGTRGRRWPIRRNGDAPRLDLV